VDFKNTVIIMTTNLGTRDIAKGLQMGFQSGNDTVGREAPRQFGRVLTPWPGADAARPQCTSQKWQGCSISAHTEETCRE
jgi:hypothetical protein